MKPLFELSAPTQLGPGLMAEVFKPYLWLATVAFLVGFVSYLVLGQAPAAVAAAEPTWTAPVSAPVSAEWNVPKRI